MKTLLPPPRRPVRAMDSWPLFAFLAVYGLFMLILELTDTVLFINPQAFALFVIAPWFWWMNAAGYSGLTGARQHAALFIRLLLLGLVIAMLAEPRTVRTNDKLSVIFVLDQSESIQQEMRKASLEYIAKVTAGKPPTDEAGLVLFGRNAAVDIVPTMSFPLAEYRSTNAYVVKEGTNIASGLSMAGAVIKDDVQGRIVLISEGVGTEGNLAPVLDELKSRGIAVDVLPIDYSYQDEVWVETLQLPRFTKEGDTYNATVIVSSLQDGAGTLSLEENGQVIYREENVPFKAGKNSFAIPIRKRGPGFYEYVARMQANEGQDSIVENNLAMNFLHLEGKGRVAIVADAVGDERDWRSIARALQEYDREVTIISSDAIPRDPLALLPYDSMIFANVPRDAFDDVQLQAVHDAIQNQGMGFLMVGGDQSFGPGGWHSSKIEDALPVAMDIKQRKIMPKGALAIILHTCEFDQGNTWAKRITKESIKVLNDQDEAGVLGYDWNGGDGWIVNMMPVSQYNLMATRINAAQIGDMPSFIPTMGMALTALKNSDASSKHMIIISDGDPTPPSPALLQQYVDNKITISTIAVFPHGGTTTGALQGIASSTGGRFYYPQSANLLPQIFIKEAKTIQRSLIQDRPEGFVPKQTFYSPIIQDMEYMPELYGYVITTPKEGLAQKIMEIPDSEDKDPLLSVWTYGLGKTAAFTSDLSPRWGSDWLNWNKYQAFVKQLVTEISRVRKVSNLRMQSFAAGTEGVVIIEDYKEDKTFLELSAEVQGPDSKAQTLTLEQVGPGRYEARFPLWGVGRYQVTVTGARDGGSGSDEDGTNIPPVIGDPNDPDTPLPNDSADAAGSTERVFGGFAVPYSQEFMRFHADTITLREILDKTGGRQLTGEETGKDIYDIPREVRQSSSPFVSAPFPWPQQWPRFFLVNIPLWAFLVTSLLLLDVAIRRVHIEWSMVAGWFTAREVSTQQTMDALRRAKKTTTEGLLQKQETTVAPVRPQAPPRSRGGVLTDEEVRKYAGDTAKPTAKPVKPGPTPTTDESTTSRLLALKRKQRGEGGDTDEKQS